MKASTLVTQNRFNGLLVDIMKDYDHGMASTEEDKKCVKLLGLANFYWQFVKGFSKIATPLNKLIRKIQPWEWMKEQQTAFDTLKT